MIRRISSLLLVAFVLFGAIAFAQAPTGIITGTITDASGAVIPSANVVITNKDSGATRTIIASSEGLFSAPALPAGNYEVRAERSRASARWSARLKSSLAELQPSI